MPRPTRHNPPRTTRRYRRHLRSAVVVAVMLMALTVDVHADPRIEPFIAIDAPESYDMGTVMDFNSPHEPDDALMIQFAANIPHNGLTVSITPLAHGDSSQEIARSQIFVREPGSGLWQPLNQARNITGPVPPGLFQVDLAFRLQDLDVSFPPGEYNGVLTLTLIGD